MLRTKAGSYVTGPIPVRILVSPTILRSIFTDTARAAAQCRKMLTALMTSVNLWQSVQ